MELSHHIVNNEANCVVFFIYGDVNLVCSDSRQRPNVVINVALVKCNVWNVDGLEHFKDELSKLLLVSDENLGIHVSSDAGVVSLTHAEKDSRERKNNLGFHLVFNN